MKKFKISMALGEESTTDEFFVDSNGKAWPVYTKLIDLGAGPNATSKSVNHSVANLKADGHFRVAHAQFVKAATAPVVLGSTALYASLSLTQITVTAAADLTTFAG